MLIQRATLLDGAVVDIRVDERISAVAPTLTRSSGEQVLDAAGGTVIPALHDHHVHLRSAAAALASVRVGPDEVRDRDGLVHALRTAPVGEDGWIRAVGYHEAVAGPLDRFALDAVAPAVPVRVQHRSGVSWTLNSAGLARVGLPDHPDGWMRSADRGWSDLLPGNDIGLSGLSARLAGYGVTGVTDATPDLDAADVGALADAHRRGELLQRVQCLAPGKKILHDDDLDLDALTAWIRDRHADDVPVALHAVTAPQLVVALSALRTAGRHSGDRIEHAAVVPDESVDDLTGITVVTQPNFVAERGDQYLTDIPEAEHHELWRLRSLLAAGVRVALSTDAPFGDADPWAAMRAAVRRSTGSGQVLGADERVEARTALTLFLGHLHAPAESRAVAAGQPGDLVVLAASPAEVLDELDAGLVTATIAAGKVIHSR